MSDQKIVREYHQSSIAMFLKCPRQYMYRYLQKLVMPPKAALTLGSAIDLGTTHNYKQKIVSKKDLSTQDVLDVYSTEFDKRTPETVWDGEDSGKIKDHGAKMMKVFHETASPKIQPLAVQDAFKIETSAGYNLGGTMDLVDENRVIRDTKTSKANYAEDALDDNLQATMYDFAYQAKYKEKATGFAFDVITKHVTPRYQEVKGQISSAQTERMFESINIMHSQIERGEFQYAPEGQWYCSKEWCGYWSMCKGKK